MSFKGAFEPPCNYCSSAGHGVDDCPLLSKNRTSPCRLCGASAHCANYCPTKCLLTSQTRSTKVTDKERFEISKQTRNDLFRAMGAISFVDNDGTVVDLTKPVEKGKRWIKCTMRAAIKHSYGRNVDEKKDKPIPPENGGGDVTLFTDGTAVACQSKYHVTDQERAFGVVTETPAWWIYE